MSEQKVWDGKSDRRQNPPIPTGTNPPTGELWNFIVQELQTIKAQNSAMHMDMVGHKTTLDHVLTDVEEIKKGFPKTEDGERDYDGHHDHHDRMIRTAKKWGEIWTDVAKKLFGGIAWVCVVFVAYAIWEKIKRSARIE